MLLLADILGNLPSTEEKGEGANGKGGDWEEGMEEEKGGKEGKVK